MELNQLLFDRYRLKASIGRGSFGEVWLAYDEVADLDVAVKIYVALDSYGIEEFRKEFKGVHDLIHQNILRPEHFAVADSCPFLVMPLCTGSVERRIGKMTEREVWQLMRDVGAGLAYLHHKEIIHRDIKPDNILLNQEGSFLISDFGISTQLRSTLMRSTNGQHQNLSGTIPYMAPELFTKRPLAVKATDIWALGVTLYEVLEGELPFFGQGGSMLNHGAAIPQPGERWSPALRDTVEACLALEPWERPTAEELSAYAEAQLKGLPAPMPWLVRAGKTGKETVKYPPQNPGDSQDSQNSKIRKPLWLGLALLAVVLLSIFGIRGCNDYRARRAEEQRMADSLARVEQLRQDSIARAEREADSLAQAAREKARQDSIARANRAEQQRIAAEEAAARAREEAAAQERARQEAEARETARHETVNGLSVTWGSNVTNEQKSVLRNLINNMVYVAGGSFRMGSNDSDADSDESPVHSVTLSSYRIGRYEVTQQEWQTVMGSNPSNWKGSNLPVERISYYDCLDFVKGLKRMTGLSFRLPTEAEWEFAARGGNRGYSGYKYSGSNSIGTVAWYDGNSGDRTHYVGQKSPNELGLYDMTGNVWEWCHDWYGAYSSTSLSNPKGPSSGSGRVLRGGSWGNCAGFCRVAYRNGYAPECRRYGSGVRLAL